MTVIAAAAELSDDALEGAGADLTAALGRPARPSEVASLRRQADGTFVMAIYKPTISARELGEDVDRPWAVMGGTGLSKITTLVSIRAAADQILNPASDHNECARRDRLWERAHADLEEQQKREREQTVEERERQQRVASERRAFEQHDGASWGGLPLEAKLAYQLAIAIDDGIDLAAALRRLGGIIERTGMLPFPGRRYR